MKIYISIPITGHDLATQQAKAAEIAEKIKALGHEPVNPFDTPAAPSHLDEKETYAYYMGEDIKRLLMCDAILLCEGWQRSKGCKAEFNIAMVYGLADFGCIEGIPKERETDIREDFLKEFSELLRKYDAKIESHTYGGDDSWIDITIGGTREQILYDTTITADNMFDYDK